jgi:hypothetical protein
MEVLYDGVCQHAKCIDDFYTPNPTFDVELYNRGTTLKFRLREDGSLLAVWKKADGKVVRYCWTIQRLLESGHAEAFDSEEEMERVGLLR